MKHVLIPTIAAFGLMVAPAFAQSSSAATTHNTSQATQQQGNQKESAQQIEQSLRSDLSKAGYTDIHIMPGSFLVQAKNSQGEPTEMMISPNSIRAVTAMNTTTAGQAGNGSHSSNSTTGNGTTKE